MASVPYVPDDRSACITMGWAGFWENMPPALQAGAWVMTQWKKLGGEEWGGVVKGIDQDGLYTIQYDDGMVDKKVTRDRIRPIFKKGDRVVSQWQGAGNQEYKGTIIHASDATEADNLDPEDEWYTVKYDDGEIDENVTADRIVPLSLSRKKLGSRPPTEKDTVAVWKQWMKQHPPRGQLMGYIWDHGAKGRKGEEEGEEPLSQDIESLIRPIEKTLEDGDARKKVSQWLMGEYKYALGRDSDPCPVLPSLETRRVVSGSSGAYVAHDLEERNVAVEYMMAPLSMHEGAWEEWYGKYPPGVVRRPKFYREKRRKFIQMLWTLGWEIRELSDETWDKFREMGLDVDLMDYENVPSITLPWKWRRTDLDAGRVERMVAWLRVELCYHQLGRATLEEQSPATTLQRKKREKGKGREGRKEVVPKVTRFKDRQVHLDEVEDEDTRVERKKQELSDAMRSYLIEEWDDDSMKEVSNVDSGKGKSRALWFITNVRTLSVLDPPKDPEINIADLVSRKQWLFGDVGKHIGTQPPTGNEVWVEDGEMGDAWIPLEKNDQEYRKGLINRPADADRVVDGEEWRRQILPLTRDTLFRANVSEFLETYPNFHNLTEKQWDYLWSLLGYMLLPPPTPPPILPKEEMGGEGGDDGEHLEVDERIGLRIEPGPLSTNPNAGLTPQESIENSKRLVEVWRKWLPKVPVWAQEIVAMWLNRHGRSMVSLSVRHRVFDYVRQRATNLRLDHIADYLRKQESWQRQAPLKRAMVRKVKPKFQGKKRREEKTIKDLHPLSQEGPGPGRWIETFYLRRVKDAQQNKGWINQPIEVERPLAHFQADLTLLPKPRDRKMTRETIADSVRRANPRLWQSVTEADVFLKMVGSTTLSTFTKEDTKEDIPLRSWFDSEFVLAQNAKTLSAGDVETRQGEKGTVLQKIHVLIVLDLYSKKIWAHALPDKKGKTVASALDDILVDIARHSKRMNDQEMIVLEKEFPRKDWWRVWGCFSLEKQHRLDRERHGEPEVWPNFKWGDSQEWSPSSRRDKVWFKHKETKKVVMRRRWAFVGPRIMQTDNGTEFVGKDWRYVLDKWNIMARSSDAYSPASQGAIERLNQTIKRFLMRETKRRGLEWGNGEWIHVFDRVVQLYNEQQHSHTMTAPNAIWKGWPKVHSQERRTILPSKTLAKSMQGFAVGNLVRLAMRERVQKTRDRPSGRAGGILRHDMRIEPNWSKKLYRIVKVLQPINSGKWGPGAERWRGWERYRVKSEDDGKVLPRKFYAIDLMGVDKGAALHKDPEDRERPVNVRGDVIEPQ